MQLKGIEWTPGKINKFFEYYESQPGIADNYFGRQRGRALLSFLMRRMKFFGQALEVGCGPGYFMEHLLCAKIACSGADVSESAIRLVKQKFAGHPFFKGAFLMQGGVSLPVPEESFDTVFLIETIEHVLPSEVKAVFSQIRRVIRPGGRCVITVPNQEDMAAGMITCLECGCVFHYTQHLRSFNKRELSEMVRGHGFRVSLCLPALIFPDISIWLKARKISAQWKSLCPDCGNIIPHSRKERSVSLIRMARKIPHLVCICEKSG